ncbi:MAG: AMP-dependent synthetase [Planctomycetota bacterium]|nr:MAG: AMP-dependent synthetase [Planctomycetota bacterium]
MSTVSEKPFVLPRRLLRACRSASRRIKVADTLGTRFTGGELLLRILAARRVLNRVLAPEERLVGVMLPPTVAAVVINAALSLCGRVAVNLNYSTSQSILATTIEKAGLTHVISSPVFLARVKLDVGNTLLDAGTLRKQVTLVDKIISFVQAKLLPISVLERMLGLDKISHDDILTVIFTSGSTGDPKGVMLSMENVGSNVTAIGSLLHLSPGDVAIGTLPFFHSYGYTTTLWTPLALEPACVYHTNPLEAQQVGNLVREFHGTILMTTPTFLRGYIRRIPSEDFASLEVVFGAAEKLTREVCDAFESRFKVRPWEAYGATELSPLVSVNVPPTRQVPGRPPQAREGTVGRPIPGCRTRITQRDSFIELPVGQEGMLWISGPNVMKGYLNRPDLTAEVVKDGWYRTGDIAKIDADGFITITGRQSRFSKIGGEMVPHIRVEEAINQAFGASGDEIIAVVGAVSDLKKGERLVVLHLTSSITPVMVCKKMSEMGIPNLWIPSPDSFLEIDSIPVLGTGKLDLKSMETIAQERFGVSSNRSSG